MKHRGETCLKVNYAVVLQVFHLLVGRSLQGLSSLHDSDRMYEAFQVFRQVPLVGALQEPGRQGLWIFRG
jgi:hypothetical protein